MPNRPPYPREARVVAVEKGPQGQTVTGISSVRIILSLIRLSANILPSRKPWMPNGVMKILTSRNPEPELPAMLAISGVSHIFYLSVVLMNI